MLLKSTFNSIFHVQKRLSSRNILSLKDRGMFQEIFPENSAGSVVDILNGKPQTVYAGFDPTAKSLHVGNLLVLINLLHWQRGGHQVIALVGGATAKIGDPSGRNTEREALTKQSIDSNILGLKLNIEKIFENHKKYFWKDKSLNPVRIVNNDDWYKNLSIVELLGGAGRHLRMGTLLSRSSVESRLNSPSGMSFTEFSYQLFQAYDWLHLFERFECRFQIGGSDQMGNIMSGQELISKRHKKQVYGLTLPIITTEMGNKFGKSAGNAVWLSADETTPFEFYQFWMRLPDGEIRKMLRLFTFESVGFIEDLMGKHSKQPELRLGQKYLAEQVTMLVHGEEGLERAQNASKILYENNLGALQGLNEVELGQVFKDATIVELMEEAGQSMLDLAMKAGCFKTKADAIRIIAAGGFHVNQQRVTHASEVISSTVHRLKNNVSLLRVGKRNYYIVKWLS